MPIEFLKENSAKLDGIIRALVEEAQEALKSVNTRIAELNELLKEKEMQTDRSENASFQIAKDERDMKVALSLLYARRIASLQEELIPYNSTGFIAKGSTVKLVVETINGKNPELNQTEFICKLVSHDTSTAKKGLISIDSKVGAAILNRREGDTVSVKAPMGLVTYKIEGVY